MLALVVGPSIARGGEVPSSISLPQKPVLEFRLWDESSDKSLQTLLGSPYDDDDDLRDEDVYVKKGVLGLQNRRKYPTKVLTEEEKRIWSAVSWPSTLDDVLHRSIEMAMVKIKLTVDAFWATPSMIPLIPSPKIAPTDVGSLPQILNDIPEETLPSSPLKYVIDDNLQHILSVLNKKKKQRKESYL